MADPTPLPYQPFPPFSDWRSIGFDARTFSRFASIFESTRRAAKPENVQRAVDTATRWAAVDTGAIEGLYEVDRGFTFSVAVEGATWESIHQLKGVAVERAIRDALEAYEYVLDLVTQSKPLTTTWLRELHATICASQETYTVVTSAGPQEQPLEKGAYKKYSNNPLNLALGTIHSYAPVSDTPAETQRLVDELSSEPFLASHPVLQAAYAHYGFVTVHPFADGNGRVARALASSFLYRSPGVPLVIFADQKGQYLDALEAADAGDPAPFVQFIADRAIDTIQMVRTSISRAPGPTLQERLSRLQKSLTDKSGLAHDEIDALAGRLTQAMHSALRDKLNEMSLQAPLSGSVNMLSGNLRNQPEGYRLVPANAHYVQASVQSAPPAKGSKGQHYGVGIARPDQPELTDFVIYTTGGEVVVEVLLREMHPTMSAALTYRLEAVAEDNLLRLVGEVVEEGELSLRTQGYTA